MLTDFQKHFTSAFYRQLAKNNKQFGKWKKHFRRTFWWI